MLKRARSGSPLGSDELPSPFDQVLVIPATPPPSPMRLQLGRPNPRRLLHPIWPGRSCRQRQRRRRHHSMFLPDFQVPDIQVDKEKKKKKKNKRWKWTPLMSRIMKRRNVQKKKNNFAYPVHCIRPKGFTEWEFLVCEGYMFWYDFEFKFPIRKKYRRFKRFIDQVRRTKGYGVTLTKPHGFAGPNFISYDASSWEEDYTLNIYMTEMVLALIGAIQTKFKGFRPAGLQLTNAVSCPQYHMYLLSHSFEPQTITRECKRSKGEEEVEVDVVQAMLYVEPGPRVAGPLEHIHFSIEEWKLKKGSHLVYSSACTKGAEKFVERRYYKSFYDYKKHILGM